MDAKTAARIESLTHSQGWDDLKEFFEGIESRYWKRHIADLKAGKPLDQRELDRALGHFDGIRAILKAPVKAAEVMSRKQQQGDEAA